MGGVCQVNRQKAWNWGRWRTGPSLPPDTLGDAAELEGRAEWWQGCEGRALGLSHQERLPGGGHRVRHTLSQQRRHPQKQRSLWNLKRQGPQSHPRSHPALGPWALRGPVFLLFHPQLPLRHLTSQPPARDGQQPPLEKTQRAGWGR